MSWSGALTGKRANRPSTCSSKSWAGEQPRRLQFQEAFSQRAPWSWGGPEGPASVQNYLVSPCPGEVFPPLSINPEGSGDKLNENQIKVLLSRNPGFWAMAWAGGGPWIWEGSDVAFEATPGHRRCWLLKSPFVLPSCAWTRLCPAPAPASAQYFYFCSAEFSGQWKRKELFPVLSLICQRMNLALLSSGCDVLINP